MNLPLTQLAIEAPIYNSFSRPIVRSFIYWDIFFTCPCLSIIYVPTPSWNRCLSFHCINNYIMSPLTLEIVLNIQNSLPTLRLFNICGIHLSNRHLDLFINSLRINSHDFIHFLKYFPFLFLFKHLIDFRFTTALNWHPWTFKKTL